MAEIVGVHGIRGMVKLKVFSDNPDSLTGGAPLCDSDGKLYKLASLAPHGNIWLAQVEGLTDRTLAEKLRGTKLYRQRDSLPEIKKKDPYYHADLIGMAALLPDKTSLGTVIAIANFGAGDLLEIKPAKGQSFYVPFTNAVVPHVDVKAKTLTVDPPPGLLD
ncbi:MAG: ribosome maturation factor RimM [Alphaproteobacteria bacterium]